MSTRLPQGVEPAPDGTTTRRFPRVRTLILFVVIATVSSLLALAAGAEEQPAADAVAAPRPDVTIAAVEPIRELSPAIEALEARDLTLAPDVSDEYVGRVAEEPDAVADRLVAFEEQQAAEAAAAERRALWDRLADCESGARDRDNTPIPGSRRWDYGLNPGEDGFFQGGLQFHPETWDAFKDPGMPDHAGQAAPAVQIAVAERVLARQGWRAWPVCSRMLGLRG